MTLNHTLVKADLENFPVLIDIVDSDLKSKTQFDGDDIVFTIDHNSTLSYEIELYDPNTGHLVAWVKISLLSSTADTELFIYYGNPNAPKQSNPAGVWDSNFSMVQHFEEVSGTRFDSTNYGNNAVLSGTVAKASLGKIDGTDSFNSNGYERVTGGFLPTSAITVELWLKPSSYSTTIWTKFINTGPTTTRGISGGQTSRTSDRWYLGLSWDSGAKSFNTGDIISGYGWNHIVVTWNGTYCFAYVNGVKTREGAFSGTADWVGRPLYIGSNYYGGELFNGTIDEVRVSGVARSASWIQASYNNQKDPATFYTVGSEESQSSTAVTFEYPQNGATEIYTNPALSARIINPNGQNMTIIFKEKSLDTWIDLKTYENVPDGTYYANATQMKKLGTTYYWSTCVNDGLTWTNKTFVLTTTRKVLAQKWLALSLPKGVSGVLAADINGDGIDEVINTGKSGVIALNGTNGQTIWNVSDSGIGDHAQAQIADLNHDGILEIIVPRETPAGLLVLHANDGSTYWNITGLGKETYSGPVVFDIDGNGYPTIFLGSTDTSKGLNGTGRITSLSYNGTILNQVFVWRPCSGGLSIADTDGDGEFELYMGDRYMYLNNPEYGDNDYGKGVQSFWARNLTLRWSRPEIFCSSQKPMIADVNKDGILDIIIGDLGGGLAVLNATDGSTIRMSLGLPNDAPTHYQPSIYDIDGDGNLEMLMADFHNTTSDDLVIWDLVKWQIDAKIYIGKCFYGPQVADVNGDGLMEIIVCNYRSIFIIDKNYQVIDGIVGLSGEVIQGDEIRNIDGISGLAGTLNYAVVQDIDGDAYNELIVSTQSGSVYAFDTPARRPNPRPRSEVQFYSEYRLGVAEYVQPQGGPAPIIFSENPQNLATDMPLSMSQLQFSLIDYQHGPINYTVTTNPNIGSDTATNVANGRYTVSISNLAPSTTYTWNITATDGTNWTNRTYTFTTTPILSWWNSDWAYRKRITLDHNKVSADVSNLPILINIMDNDLASKTQADGDDIVFTDINNNQLNHEIEFYNSTAGHLIAWVKVPSVSSTNNTSIYIYYGNIASGNQQKPTLVWDSSFSMVQHLEEPSGTRYDSTSNGNNATPSGSIAKDIVGKIDGADIFNSSLYERVTGGFLPTSAITVELWLKPSSYSTTIWTKFINTGPTTTRGISGGQTSRTSDRWYLGLSWDSGAKSFNTGDIISGYGWNHIVVTWNGTYCFAYVNGVKTREGAFSGTADWVGRPLTLGSNYLPTEFFNGTIDEVRISGVARSASWIQASYNNQKDPTTFYTVGNEETIPEAILVFAPSPPDKAKNISPSLSEISFNLTNHQRNQMNYTVTTYPDIGSGSGLNVANGRYTVPVNNVQYFKTYTWTVEATDGTNLTRTIFTFTTYPSEPPTQEDPILVSNLDGSITCYNQTTQDPDDAKVTSIYNWYRNNTPTTTLLLPFETNSSTTTKDYSGYGNDGLIIRGATWTNNGKIGGAYKLDRGYIQVPGSNTLDGGGSWPEITVEHWIYLTSPQSGTVRTISRIPSYEIGISGSNIFASVWIATGNPLISGYNRLNYNATLQTNMWYHVALTYKSSIGLTLYLNGVAVANTNVTGNIQPSGFNPLSIGWFDYFKGIIDEVKIYPKSLSPQQILQRYLETKDGSSSSSTIVLQETNTGDTWKCLVTPNDSHQDGTTKSSNTLTIGYNNKPSAKNITINPVTPRTNDDLAGSYTYFDPDGDPENGTQIRWYKNDALQPELNDTLIVPAALTTKGEIWHFTVRTSDGEEYGETQTSPHTLIQNSPPTIDSFTPQNTTPTINETESIQFTHTSSDPDNDTLTYSWLLNQTEQSTAQNWTYTTDYNSAGTHNITLTVNDGQQTTVQEWTVTVLNVNRPPSISSVTITPDPAYANDTLTANPTSPYDADGDTVTFTYQWQKYQDGNWVNIAGATNQTLEPENFVQGDQIKIICTPYDSQDYGTPQEAVITIS
jgi:hypothetical protein